MVARSKAAKLAAKRGRPKLMAGIDTRERNGRLSRRQNRTEAVEQENVSTVARTRMRHFNIKTIEAATDPRQGYVLGRMLMDGTVNQRQHDAGCRYAEDMARYYGLTGIQFPSAHAQNLFAVRGSGGEDSQSRADMAKDARKRMVTLRAVLMACGDINTGRRVQHTVNLICVEDMSERRNLNSPMKAWLVHGLNALAKEYGI